MTPEGWEAAADPLAMIAAVRDRVPARKWRLYQAAAVRDARRFRLVPTVAQAVLLAERYADGLVDRHVLHAAYRRCYRGWADTELPYLLMPDEVQAVGGAVRVTQVLARLYHEPDRLAGWLREVLGNPFRWVGWEDGWATRTVHAIAAPVYAEGVWSRLPVLADALEDAGCDNVELLAHLRGPGPHARGCWALDVVLGKV